MKFRSSSKLGTLVVVNYVLCEHTELQETATADGEQKKIGAVSVVN
jgi:hypothetical protein